MVVEAVAGTAAVLLILVLLAVSVSIMLLGLYGSALGERFERCPRCHRLGLSAGGHMHPDGCPRSPHLAVASRRSWHHVTSAH